MRALVRLVVLALACALVAWALVTRPSLPAAERGRRLAERTGCFGCHGPGGLKGVPNHGRLDKTVPGFGGDEMMYAKNDDDLREWIRDGVTARRAASSTWKSDRDRGALRMPAFGRRLSAAEVNDLVAFVNASAGNPGPGDGDSLAVAGLDRADALGCTGCHGAGGRLAMRNPGSLKGYVPSWDGRDFPDLVRNRAEFDQWVMYGISNRFRENPAAGFFLHRAAVHMPPYLHHAGRGDLDALWAYVTWLRRTLH